MLNVFPGISITQSEARKSGAHRGDDGADPPHVDGVVISTDSHTLHWHDDFRNEVIGRPTHRPFGRD